jgi:hypothetical protein
VWASELASTLWNRENPVSLAEFRTPADQHVAIPTELSRILLRGFVLLRKIRMTLKDRLCGLVVRVPGYGFRGPGSIPGATRYSEKW